VPPGPNVEPPLQKRRVALCCGAVQHNATCRGTPHNDTLYRITPHSSAYVYKTQNNAPLGAATHSTATQHRKQPMRCGPQRIGCESVLSHVQRITITTSGVNLVNSLGNEKNFAIPQIQKFGGRRETHCFLKLNN